MKDFLIEKIPGWKAEIEQLIQEDRDLFEIVEDYQVVREAMDRFSMIGEASPQLIEYYGRLKYALEEEAVEKLQIHFLSRRPGQTWQNQD